jgi:hypothetical protein
MCWVCLCFGIASPLVLYRTVPWLDVLPVQVMIGATLAAPLLACEVLAFWVRHVDDAPEAICPRALRERPGEAG